MLTLFKSYDVDRSGGLDFDEFKSCLESLEFKLTENDIISLREHTNTKKATSNISFDEFQQFFMRNLLT
jgi:Ca2+-binding EF-hand superfamily protein